MNSLLYLFYGPWVLLLLLPLWFGVGYWLGWRAKERKMIEHAQDYLAALEAQEKGEYIRLEDL